MDFTGMRRRASPGVAERRRFRSGSGPVPVPIRVRVRTLTSLIQFVAITPHAD